MKQHKNIVPVMLDVTKEAEIKSAVGQISDRLTKDDLKLTIKLPGVLITENWTITLK